MGWKSNRIAFGTGDDGLPPNVLRFSCRRGAAKNVKIGTISRAEGGQLQAPVGWQARLWL